MIRQALLRQFLCAALVAVPAGMLPAKAAANSYPTETTADYVIGCMAANGQTQDALRRCSCSIDTIASAMPFEIYERADTVLRMRLVGGEAAGMFRDTPALKDVVDRLREAQVEADFRCF
ncbi:hypothetical protein KX816_17365 [Sphingosinicellaceae bacterium]|nr:hypothetical protein KX816_17365 [Sphingosinicellaceae bacterium]